MDKLSEFRAQLNDIDEQLIRLLGRRFSVCGAVARHKLEQNIPMMQPARVAEVKDRAASIGAGCGVAPDFIRRLYGLIVDEACRLEDEIIEGPGDDTKDALA